MLNFLKMKLNKTKIMRIIMLIGLTYSFFLVFLYIYQDKLLFFPMKLVNENMAGINGNAEAIEIVAADDVHLRGWLIKEPAPMPLILYFGGNAEEASGFSYAKERLEGRGLALVNYRGYGLSDGVPGEEALLQDGLAVYDYFSAREDIDKDNIVLMGRSLGSGVAVHVAKHRSPRGVILITPYDSITRVAQKKMPLFPVSLLLRHRFDSISKAPHIKTPALAFIAEDDLIVPPGHGKKLMEEWGGKREIVVLEANHNSIVNDEFWKHTNSFLRELE